MLNTFETESMLKNDFDLDEIIGRNKAKKPLQKLCSIRDNEYITQLCPNCGISLIDVKKQPFCDNCGQRLDWKID